MEILCPHSNSMLFIRCRLKDGYCKVFPALNLR
jgi:hypothetical protein